MSHGIGVAKWKDPTLAPDRILMKRLSFRSASSSTRSLGFFLLFAAFLGPVLVAMGGPTNSDECSPNRECCDIQKPSNPGPSGSGGVGGAGAAGNGSGVDGEPSLNGKIDVSFAVSSPNTGMAGKSGCYFNGVVQLCIPFLTDPNHPEHPGTPIPGGSATTPDPSHTKIVPDPPTPPSLPPQGPPPNFHPTPIISPLDSGPGGPTTTTPYDWIYGSGGEWLGTRFRSDHSTAEVWWHASQAATGEALSPLEPFLEVKHTDGSVAHYESFGLLDVEDAAGDPQFGWRLLWVRDPYDNQTDYTYRSQTTHEVATITYPSGIEERWTYYDSSNPAPTGLFDGWSTATHSFLHVTYHDMLQAGVEISGTDWAMVFENLDFTSGGGGTVTQTHFQGRAVGRYTQPVEFIDYDGNGFLDPTAVQNARFCATMSYQAQTRMLLELKQCRTWASGFASPSSGGSTTNTATVPVQSFTYDASGRVASKELVLEGVVNQFEYDNTPGRTASGITMARVTTVDGLGNRHHRDYDVDTGRVFRDEMVLADNAKNRPRAYDPDWSVLQAAHGVEEPAILQTDYDFEDLNCVCQKPSKITRRGLDDSGAVLLEREWDYVYDPDTRLIILMSMPNPSVDSSGQAGGMPVTVSYTYTSEAANNSAVEWSAVWPLSITQSVDPNDNTDDIVISFEHTQLRPRANSALHGYVAQRTERTLLDLTLMDPSGTTAMTNGAVWRVDIEGGLGSTSSPGIGTGGVLNGLATLARAPDGVAIDFNSYDNRGRLTSLTVGATTTTTTYDVWGNATQVTTNATAGNSDHTRVTTVQTSFGGAPYSISSVVGGNTFETQFFYDEWGNLGVVRRTNEDASGGAPLAYGQSSSSARAYVEDQFHYHGNLLLSELRDRRPLDQPRSAPWVDAEDAMWLRTDYDYDPLGRVESITHPNQSFTELQLDGYGELYTAITHATDPNAGGGSGSIPSVHHARSFVNGLLEPVSSHVDSEQGPLWTVIERTGAGSVVSITEPSIDPSDLPPELSATSLGGLQTKFERDALGRATRTYSQSGPTILTNTYATYDEMSRVIRTVSRALNATGGTVGASASDFEFVSIATYHPANPLQLAGTTSSGPTGSSVSVAYAYDGFGRTASITDALGNFSQYGYFTGTDWVKWMVRDSVDTSSLAGGTAQDRTDTTEYSRDGFGRVTRIEVKGTSASATTLVHQFAFNSLHHRVGYTDPMLRDENYLTDALGRLVQHAKLGTNPGTDDIVMKSVFVDRSDIAGESRIERVDGVDNVTKSYLDFMGRLEALMMPGASVRPSSAAKNQKFAVYAEYDNASRRTALFDGEGGETQFLYDGAGRLIQSELVSVYGQTPVGSLPSSMSLVTTRDLMVRDALGRVLETRSGQKLAGGGYGWTVENTFVTDSFGRTSRSGTHVLGSDNEMVVTREFSGPTGFRSSVSYADNLGISHPFSTPLAVGYGPDVLGRIDSVTWDRADAGQASNPQSLASFGFVGGQKSSRLLEIQGDPSSAATHRIETYFSWDQFGRLAQIRDDLSALPSGTPTTISQFDYEFDDAGNLLREIYSKQGGGVGDRFEYDDHNRLITAWLGSDSMLMTASDPHTSGSADRTTTFGQDEANNRTTVSSVWNGGSSSSTDTYTLETDTNRYATKAGAGYVYDNRGNLIFDGQYCYLYDYRNRLSEVLVATEQSQASSGGGTTSTATSSAQLSSSTTTQREPEFTVVDERGFLNTLRAVRASCGDVEYRARCVDDPNYYESNQRSSRGAVVEVAPGGGGLWPWPGSDQGATLTPLATYAYDAYNRRTLRVAGELGAFANIWDGWREAQEALVQPTGADIFLIPRQQYVWGVGLDELLAFRNVDYVAGGATNDYWVVQGGQDTTAVVVRDDGQVISKYEYRAYGRARGFAIQTPSPDPLVPFLYKGMRYDPETGNYYRRHRYYSHKDGRFLSRDWIGAWGDYGNLGNAYGYVGNHPTRGWDPMGLQVAESLAIAGDALAGFAVSNPIGAGIALTAAIAIAVTPPGVRDEIGEAIGEAVDNVAGWLEDILSSALRNSRSIIRQIARRWAMDQVMDLCRTRDRRLLESYRFEVYVATRAGRSSIGTPVTQYYVGSSLRRTSIPGEASRMRWRREHRARRNGFVFSRHVISMSMWELGCRSTAEGHYYFWQTMNAIEQVYILEAARTGHGTSQYNAPGFGPAAFTMEEPWPAAVNIVDDVGGRLDPNHDVGVGLSDSRLPRGGPVSVGDGTPFGQAAVNYEDVLIQWLGR